MPPSLPSAQTYDTTSGPAIVRLTDNGAGVSVSGTDHTLDGAPSQALAGQYGAFSHVKLQATASDGSTLALFLAPRGGAMETAASAQGMIVDLPTSASATTRGLFIGNYTADPTQPTEIDLDTTLGGGSSGPFDLVVFPYGGSGVSRGPIAPQSQSVSAGGSTVGNGCAQASDCAGGDPSLAVTCSPSGVCVADGTLSAAGDGSDCCSGTYTPSTNTCGS